MDKKSVVKDFLTTASDGKNYKTKYYNSDFKVFETEHFKKDVGLVTFTPSVSEWVDK